MMEKEKVNRLVTRGLSYLRRRDFVDHRRVRPMELVWERAAQESADFIYRNIEKAILFDNRKDLWRHSLKAVRNEGFLVECGVFEGESINFFADWIKARDDDRLIYGFDSFEGLEEDWAGENLPVGYFDAKGNLPAVRSNVRLRKGWVQDTIAPFVNELNVEKIALLHIDTDTYSPAKYLLGTLKEQLKGGGIVIFDELVGYPNWANHEYRALNEEFDDSEYEYIAFTSRQATIRVL